MEWIRKCLNCQDEFKTASNTKKYCCERCFRLHHGYTKNLPPKEIKCDVCENIFQTTKYHQKYCSKECRVKFWAKKSYLNNRQKRLDYASKPERREKNRIYNTLPQIKARRNEGLKERRKKDPLFKLKSSINDRLRRNPRYAGKYKIAKIEEYLGYKLSDLLNELEKKLSNNLSLSAYLNRELELDHIIPYSLYLSMEPGDEEFRKCWSMKNLRLISKNDNRERERNAFFDIEEIRKFDLVDILPKSFKEVFNLK